MQTPLTLSGDAERLGQPTGIRRWLTTTNHKDIGTLYLCFSFTMFIVGGLMALIIRAELFQPGLQFVHPELFNQLTTMHGLIMVFGAFMPAFVGFANWQIPMMIGASDMAFPRLNNFSFWLLPPAAILLVGSLFAPGGATGAGWTLYPPLSVQMGPGMDMAIFAIHMLGVSSIIGSINIVTTILNMRAPGMTLMKMPLFVWTWLVTGYLLIVVMPVLAGAMTMLLTDRHFDTHFFNAAGGGDPVLFQHIFWFFGHPEVYILILPAFGIVSEIIPTFARKPLFGYRSMVFATCAIGIVACSVWAHHMFTAGMPVAGQLFFMYASLLVAVPTGVKVFNWVATMWEGSLTFETPMLFAVGFLFVFVVGGITGVILAVAPVDVQLQDTYYVVAHFHYVMVAGSLFGLFAAALLAFDDLLQPHVLRHALSRARGNAAPHSGLPAAVRGFQHDRQHRRVRLRIDSVAVFVHGDEVHPRGRKGLRKGLGRRDRAGVDAAVAAAAPYLRGAAGHQIADANDDNAHTPRNGQGESCDEAEVHPCRRHHVRIRLPAGAVLRADLQGDRPAGHRQAG